MLISVNCANGSVLSELIVVASPYF